MNPTFHSRSFVAITTLGSAAVLFWFVSRPSNNRIVRRHIVIVDTSGSMREACDSAAAGVGQAYDKAAEQGEDLQITLLGTGSPKTANEPMRKEWPRMRLYARVIEGKARAQATKAAFVRDVRAACGAWQGTSVSAIYIAVQRAFEQLSAGSPDEEGVAAVGEITVVTDLEDNVSGLRSRAGTKQSPALLDNTDIAISFCGYSETKGQNSGLTLTPPRGANSSDQLIRMWSAHFTHSDRVVFRPFCPQLTDTPVTSSP